MYHVTQRMRSADISIFSPENQQLLSYHEVQI